MPLQATSGAASYDAFGGGVPAVPNYIEDVFSTWLIKPSADYSSYSINNGVDLSTKGGMTWFKARDAAQNNLVYDTARGSSVGAANALVTNNANGQQTTFFDYVTPNTNGFTVNYAAGGGQLTNSGINYASWTFRKQPKFFDVVTYTGNGVAGREIPHNLGSVPGCIILKSTSEAGVNWNVFHRSIAPTGTLRLNLADAQTTNFIEYYFGNDTSYVAPTSTVFTVGGSSAGNQVNGSGATYVAYLFAHNAGGFGLTGTDNVISCGSFTTDAFGDPTTVNLGYEPQWVLLKSAASAASWFILDNMRGWSNSSSSKSMTLLPNTSGAEAFGTVGADNLGSPTATGFTIKGVNAADTMIYIAIRRGPMAAPTSGTSVFYPTTYTGTGSARTFSGFGFPPDMELSFSRGGIAAGDGNGPEIYDKLRGPRVRLLTPVTNAEYTTTESVTMLQDGISVGATTHSYINFNGYAKVLYGFKRAPSFFDEVCYTSAVAATNHNLGIAPELVIVKTRGSADSWAVFVAQNGYGFLNSTSAWAGTGNGSGLGVNLANATITTIDALGSFFGSGSTLVAYLFATCAGVSKVFSYTGNGSSQTINCGFTGGARFVLIKRTDSTGDWYVWDSARGIVSGNDPHLSLNSTAAEVTTDDTIDTDSTGFVVNQVSATNVNVSSATYIGLAIA